jgi:hypothetical protein
MRLASQKRRGRVRHLARSVFGVRLGTPVVSMAGECRKPHQPYHCSNLTAPTTRVYLLSLRRYLLFAVTCEESIPSDNYVSAQSNRLRR